MTSACAESDCLTPSSVNGRKFFVIISINSGLCRNEVTGGLKSGGQLLELSSLLESSFSSSR